MSFHQFIQKILGNQTSNRRFVAVQAGGLYAVRILYKAINFGIAILLARWLGQSMFGTYTLAWSWAALLAIPAALGMERLTVREVSIFAIGRQWELLKGYVAWMFPRAAISSLTAGAIMILGAGLIYRDDPAARAAFIAAAFLIPMIVIVRQLQATQDGLKNMTQGRIPDMVIQPVAFLVIVAALYWQTPAIINAPNVIAIYVITTLIISVGIGAWRLSAQFPAEARHAAQERKTAAWIESTRYFLVIAIVFNADSRMSTLLLGALAEKTDVATYGVITRVVDLLTFILISVGAPVSRLAIRYFQEGAASKLQTLLTQTAKIITFIGWTFGALLIVFGKWYLLIFGENYLFGYPGLILLTLAEMINLATGISGLLLGLAKHEKIASGIVTAGLMFNVILGVILIPTYGLIGAAIAEMSSVIFRNIALSITTYKLMGVDPTVLSALSSKKSADNDPQQSAKPKIKILYIAGEGRSGSTIIGNVLGEMDHAFSAGEIGYLWSLNQEHARYCSCKEELKDCPVWQKISLSAFNRTAIAQADAPPVQRFRRIVRALLRYYLKNTEPESIDFFSKLYEAIGATTNSRWIIDESKDPEHLLTLHHLPNVEVWTLHLARDPRGVAFSWMRKKKRAASDNFMPQYAPHTTADRWWKTNWAIELMFGRSSRYHFLRYEDFTANPRKEIEAIMAWMGMPGAAPFVSEREVTIQHDHHLIASNPIGSSQGTIAIRADDEWRAQMSAWDKWIVTLITLPMLIKYRYL
jgi:O-antigen/teichoic acid export membrane protein